MITYANEIFNEDLSKSTVYYNLNDFPKITQLLSLYVSRADDLFRNKHIEEIKETEIYTECLDEINEKYEFLAVDAPVCVNEYLSSELKEVKKHEILPHYNRRKPYRGSY